MSSTDLEVRAGLPFSRRVRITDGKTIWATLGEFEARMHVRVTEDSSSRLKYNFTPHLVKSYDEQDIIIEWSLTGAQTALLKIGYYDLILSDAGLTDERAIRVLHGYMNVHPTTTSAEGVT